MSISEHIDTETVMGFFGAVLMLILFLGFWAFRWHEATIMSNQLNCNKNQVVVIDLFSYNNGINPDVYCSNQ